MGFRQRSMRQEDKIHRVPVCEPDIADARWGSPSLERPCGNASENAIAWDICALLESFASKDRHSNHRALWFRVPRGEIDDWMSAEEYRDYAEMHDSSYEDVERGRAEEWAEWFPEDWYWHTLETNSEDDWAIVAVDSRVVIEVRPNEVAPYENPRLRNALEKLRSVAAELVDMGLHGSYQALISDELPSNCHYGFVCRSVWWDRLGKESLFDDGKLGEEEAHELADLIAAQPDEDSIGRLPKLSAGAYFEALKGAYAAAGFIHDDKCSYISLPPDDGRAWYLRFGDARDESILSLDQGSPEAFEAWFSDSSRFFNHTFEIIAGSGISRVHLYPRHDERGWHFVLSGALTWRAPDMARIWRYLNANGFPTYLVEAPDIARMLLGQDELLVVPFNEGVWYQGTEHFGHHVITCVHLPEDNAAAIIPEIDWVKEPAPEISTLSVSLSAVQVGTLINALDFYSRMWIGQYSEVEWRMRLIASNLEAVEEAQTLREEKWLEMRTLVFPGLRNMGLSGSYGIWSQEVCDRAQSAYDMQQVIRHAWAWHHNPEGGIGVSFDNPWIRGLLPAVSCSCSDEGEKARCLIRLIPAHVRLAVDTLEVSRLLLQGKVQRLMVHYTDNDDALSVAGDIERLIPPLGEERTVDLTRTLDDLIGMFKALPGTEEMT